MNVRESFLPQGPAGLSSKTFDAMHEIRERCVELRMIANRMSGGTQAMKAHAFAAKLNSEDGTQDNQGKGIGNNAGNSAADNPAHGLGNNLHLGENLRVASRSGRDDERWQDESRMSFAPDKDAVITALPVPYVRHDRDPVSTVTPSLTNTHRDMAADICRWVTRLHASNGHDGKRAVKMQMADDVLPDTHVSVAEEEGRLGVVFDCARDAAAEALCACLPTVAWELSQVLSRDVVARVAIAVPRRRYLLETLADAPAAASDPESEPEFTPGNVV